MVLLFHIHISVLTPDLEKTLIKTRGAYVVVSRDDRALPVPQPRNKIRKQLLTE